MADGVADLTEKEKEALRLLLQGHDAKSSANELGLSVHTVNDRLRNARRKLEVSSSREAARILGDTESASPENAVHTSFGIAADNQPGTIASPTNPNAGRSSRIVWLAGGMLVMSILIATAVVALVQTTGGDPGEANAAGRDDPQQRAASANPSAMQRRADIFLAAVDAENWDESWQIAGAYFQSSVSQSDWTKAVEPVRAPLGAVEERRLATEQVASTLPGMPEGDYTVLQYQTVFAQRDMIATETVIMMNGPDGPEIIGYFVR